MKRCTVCGAQYPDDANFCPLDGGRLESVQDAPAPVVVSPGGGEALGGRFVVGAALGVDASGQIFAARDKVETPAPWKRKCPIISGNAR